MVSNFGNHEGGGVAVTPAHVLAIPIMNPSHMTPLLRFTSHLARRGITVSYVCFEDSIPSLNSSGGNSALDPQSQNFRFVTVGSDDMKGDQKRRDLKVAINPLVEGLICDKSAGVAGPTCIISDMFLHWSLQIAEELDIPRYMFVPSGVIFARFIQGSLDYFERGLFKTSTDGKLKEFDWSVCIPGLPPLLFSEIDTLIRRDPLNYRKYSESMTKSAGVLVNSFFELEEKVVEAFQNPGQPGEEHTKVPKIYPLGPLFSMTELTNSASVSGLEDSRVNCMLWLDSQPSSSVIYIAFGTQIRLSSEQFRELAYALEASNQRFLWVCPVKNVADVLPPGFQAGVGDRSCIVTGWAPQLEILAHSSTAGFVTHCGWNSSLESIIFGVPMIAWPQGAEQHLNCRYLVDHLKVAEEIQAGKEGTMRREEIERAVRVLMVEDEGREIRGRAEELQRKAKAAMGEGGSQSRYFEEFLNDVSAHL